MHVAASSFFAPSDEVSAAAAAYPPVASVRE